MQTLLGRFGVKNLLEMLLEIGVPVYKTADGWYYPLSNSAVTVADAFYEALDQADVNFHFLAGVKDIQGTANGYRVVWAKDGVEEQQVFPKVIVAAGGKAYPALGSRGDLFKPLEQIGLHVLPKKPALAPVLADLKQFSALQGVRMDAGATLLEGNRVLGSTAGNLIFTEWGLNGPAVMDLSHLITARPDTGLTLSLDLLAFFQSEFDELLNRKKATGMRLRVFLEAFLPPKAAMFYLKQAGFSPEIRMNQVDDPSFNKLMEQLHNTRFLVKGVRGFEYCQISAGGVPVDEVNPATMEAYRARGLYLTGETLDVSGPCGGYNLQFAFSSGAVAGQSAADNS
jgi:predicted Rossmann fold flavoprotein